MTPDHSDTNYRFMKFGFCPICGGCSFYCPIYRPYSWLLFSYWMWWTDSSNRSTAPWRPRVFFSSCSLQVQWSRYLCIFVLMYLCLCWFSLIQDRALVASKHFLVETEDKNLVDNTVDRLPCSLCVPKYFGCTPSGCRCIGQNRKAGVWCINKDSDFHGYHGDYMVGK